MPTPTEVRYVSAEDALHVQFDDGAAYEYPTVYLRGYCPCARCQGHGGGGPSWVQPTSREQVTIENVTPVGNYALCIVWGDGHDTGIYTFASLAELGPRTGQIPGYERSL